MRQLNALLNALWIPIPLQSPTELTPSLLIAILESLLSERIPYDVQSDTPENLKLQNTKIFLGVLETDVLKMDVGLSNLDPRKLADGGLEECIHIGELLCWVGRRLKFIVAEDPFEMDDEAPSYPNEPHSPSTSATTKESLSTSALSMHYSSDSNTSTESVIPSTTTPKSAPKAIPTPRRRSRPRCIYEISSPSVGSPLSIDGSMALGSDFLDTSPPRMFAVRRTGYISPVDEESELLSFERSRSLTSGSFEDRNDNSQPETTFSLTALRESTARTLSLVQERARLLDELAHAQSQYFGP
ncbi:hypothetical protein DXG01_001635 [Tephrocybe rancida]|nr:hypothetical protein DXG01_001635 [Tephrocybe rancida]